VWAWGTNNVGQLGDGTTVSTEVPVQVTGLSQVTSISAGYDASLATSTRGNTALMSVWAWGGNSQGQLGDGVIGGTSGPVQVASLGSVSQVSAGADFSLAMGAVPSFVQAPAS